jgi:glycosyltransferase involved in cell wall biosynthesis
MPLISIVVPACNAEKTILQTINSVIKQSFIDFELLVINDGSTDDTLKRLEEIHDRRLRVYSIENQGVAAARNWGIEKSKGQYISFIDADDLWAPRKLEMQLEKLEKNSDAGVAYSWTVVIDVSGKYLFAQSPPHFEGDVFAPLRKECFIASGSNILMLRQCVKSVGFFDQNFVDAHDWEYYIRLAKKWPFVMVPQYHIFYRYSPSSMCTAIRENEIGESEVIQRAYTGTTTALRLEKKESFSNMYLHLAFICLSRSPDPIRIREAGIYLKKSFKACRSILGKLRFYEVLCFWVTLELIPKRFSGITAHAVLRLYGVLMKAASIQLRSLSIPK